MGHPAYDLASMLQDARVDIAFDEADALYAQYCALRAAIRALRPRRIRSWPIAILGAQRATKILGIFARLSKRDGKHGYLRHMPRVSRYLERNLRTEAAGASAAWFDRQPAGAPSGSASMSIGRRRPWCWPRAWPAHAAPDLTRGPSRWSRWRARRSSTTASTGCARPRSRTAVVNVHYLPEQIEAWAARQARAAHRDLGRARRNPRYRRRHRQGPAAARTPIPSSSSTATASGSMRANPALAAPARGMGRCGDGLPAAALPAGAHRRL